MKTKVNNGFTIVEALVSLVIISVMLIASTQLIYATQKTSRVINANLEEREVILGLQQVLTKEINKASYFFPNETGGIPSGLSDIAPNTGSDPLINKIAGYDSSFNTFYGDTLHYLSSQFVDANKIVGNDSGTLKSTFPLGAIDGSEKVYIKIFTENFIYPKIVTKGNESSVSLVLWQSTSTFQVEPTAIGSSNFYAYTKLTTNAGTMTSIQKDTAVSNLTYRLWLKGFKPWQEKSPASITYRDQTTAIQSSILLPASITVLPTVTEMPNPVIKRIIANNIDPGYTYDVNQTTPIILTKKGIAFKLLRENTAVTLNTSGPSQKDLKITGVEIIVNSKQKRDNSSQFIKSRDVFTIRTLNNRVL